MNGKNNWSWLWTPNPELTRVYNKGLLLAIKWVVLPVLGLSLLVMTTGEIGLFVGGFFAVGMVIMLVVLVPTYAVSKLLADRRETTAPSGGPRGPGGHTPVGHHDAARGRTHLGGGYFVHDDGSFRDDRHRRVPADAPQFRMLSPKGINRMGDAALRAHLGWINRVHVGGGNVFAHGDGRFSDRDWNEIPADDPRVQEYNKKRE